MATAPDTAAAPPLAHAYSAAKNAFFANSMRAAYDQSGTWPSDAADIDDAIALEFMGMPPSGQIRVAGSDDMPAWAAKPEPTPDQIKVRLSGAVQRYLDAQAQLLGYDDLKTAATYADEPAVPRFQSEGKALRAWRSLVWQAAEQMLAAPVVPPPTADQVIAQLPRFVTP